jgi:hypothetical protein
MAHSIGMTGMDPQTGAALTEALEQAIRKHGGAWRLSGDQDAEFVFVDMDSMYGPMSWLRLHANGKRVIGMTSASRTQTDFHLARPFDAGSVLALLQSIVQVPGATPAAETAMPAAPPPPAPPPAAAAPAIEAAPPLHATPAPAPTDRLPEEVAAPADEEQVPESVAAPVTGPVQHAAAEAAAEREPAFLDWMAPGVLNGRFRYQRGDGPAVMIDADARQYHGPAGLKPLADAISGSVHKHDFLMVPAAEWPAAAQAAGEAQPLARLQWFAGLVAGQGSLLPGHDPLARYRLTKWPQTEREFPKHFRIATVMMKAPATLAEIAEGSGVGIGEVTDFVNANLATGYAEPWREPEPSPETQKPGGLFGRLRGR